MSANLYKPGDRVKVRKDLTSECMYGGEEVVSEMEAKAGKIVTISSIEPIAPFDNFNFITEYRIKEDDWCYTDEMFEGLAEENDMEKEIILFTRENDNSLDTLASDFNLDNPAMVMARRITALLKEDFDIIKIAYRNCDEEGVGGEATIYVNNGAKCDALKTLFAEKAEYLKITFVNLDKGYERCNQGLLHAAFDGNPIMRSIREHEDEFHIKKWFAICNREKLCQFPAGNFADYQNNYTELPADVLKKVTQHHFSYCYCTEV